MAAVETESQSLLQSSQVDLVRLIALSDGVFAFALTLLALDIRLPVITASQLPGALLDLGPKLIGYLIAFLVIASHWDGHQRTFLCFKNGDSVFMWLNLLRLLFVTLLPASTSILGSFPKDPIAAAVFGANTTLLGIAGLAQWHHAAANHRLLRDDIKPRTIQLINRIWLLNPILFALSIPIAFLNVFVSYLFWILVPTLSYLWSWRYARRVPGQLSH